MVSHISRKTSEIWGTRGLLAIEVLDRWRSRQSVKRGVLASLLMSAYPPTSLFTRLLRALAPTCVALLIGLMIGRSAAASPTPPDPRIGSVIEELEKTRKIRQVSLSPDGQMIAWAVDGRSGIEIQVAPTADPSHPHRLTAGTGAACMEEDLAWSPDSKSLAFTSDCNPPSNSSDQLDVYLVNPAASGASARRLTHLHGGVTSLAFSPDGLHIACLYIEGATRPAGALAPMKPPAGVIGVEGLEIQRVAVIEAASGEFRQVSPAGLHVYEYDWAPDSRQLAFVGAPPPGENNWWVAQLYTQALTDGQAHAILDPEHTPGPLHGLQIAVPRWSPDPATKSHSSADLMSDQGATGGDIYMVSAQGGEAKDLTPEGDMTAVWIHWLADAQPRLLVSWSKSGVVEIGSIDPDSGKNTALQTFPASVSDGRLEQSLSLDQHRNIAYIKSSFSEAPEVYLGHLKAPAHPVTHYNDGLKPLWGKSASMEWTSDKFPGPGMAALPGTLRPGQEISAHRQRAWRALERGAAALAGPGLQPHRFLGAGLLCSDA